MTTSNTTGQAAPKVSKATAARKPRASVGRGVGRGAYAPNNRPVPINVPIGARVRAIRLGESSDLIHCEGVVLAVVHEGVLAWFNKAPYNTDEYPDGKLEGLLWHEVLLDHRPVKPKQGASARSSTRRRHA